MTGDVLPLRPDQMADEAEPFALATYDALCGQIAACATVADAQAIEEKAASLRDLCKRAGHRDKEAELRWRIVHLLAGQRIGEITKTLRRTTPSERAERANATMGQRSSDAPTNVEPSPHAQALADNNLTKQRASIYERLADIPKETVETLAKETGSAEKLVERHAAAQRKAAAPPVSVEPTPAATVKPAPQPADDASLTASPLSRTAQQKLEAYQRRVLAELTARFDEAVRQEVRKEVDEIVALRSEHDAQVVAQAYEQSRRSRHPFTNEEFRLVLAALHPDAKDPERRKTAFNLFKLKELLLRKPEAKPKINPLASMREKALARRASKRGLG